MTFLAIGAAWTLATHAWIRLGHRRWRSRSQGVERSLRAHVARCHGLIASEKIDDMPWPPLAGWESKRGKSACP